MSSGGQGREYCKSCLIRTVLTRLGFSTREKVHLCPKLYFHLQCTLASVVFYFSAAVIAWDSKRADCDHEAFPFRFRSTAPPRRTQAAETI